MRGRPRKGSPVRFRSGEEVEEASSISGLRFDLDLVDGRTRVDLVAYQPRWLAILLAGEIRSRAIGWHRSTAERYLRESSRFLTFLEPIATQLSEPSQFQAAHVSAFESSVYETHAAVSARGMVQAITLLLSGVAEAHPTIFRSDLVERVRFVSERRPPKQSTPRDSYSQYVRDQLRRAAKEDAWAAIERVAERDRSKWPKMTSIRQLSLDKWFSEFGVIPHSKYNDLSFAPGGRIRYVINGAYAFTLEDVAPMIVWVCLETGLEPECCISLRIDALQSKNGKVARIRYIKNRKSGGAHQSVLVDDKSLRSVPSLIRRVIELGSVLRRHTDSDGLWLHITPRGVRSPRFSVDIARSAQLWALRRGILDDDGQPLHLLLSRLRKTHRSARYQELDGNLTKFAVNHSKEVAARNYADIPSHKHLHASAIAQAQSEVVEAAKQSGAAVRVAARPPPELDELWLASCEDIDDPPVGTPHQRCQMPFWGCLDCDNAIYSPPKLPALLEFRDRMIEARSRMTANDWSAKFGHAYRRIVESILPQFEQSQLESAGRSVSSLYVPYETFA